MVPAVFNCDIASRHNILTAEPREKIFAELGLNSSAHAMLALIMPVIMAMIVPMGPMTTCNRNHERQEKNRQQLSDLYSVHLTALLSLEKKLRSTSTPHVDALTFPTRRAAGRFRLDFC